MEYAYEGLFLDEGTAEACDSSYNGARHFALYGFYEISMASYARQVMSGPIRRRIVWRPPHNPHAPDGNTVSRPSSRCSVASRFPRSRHASAWGGVFCTSGTTARSRPSSVP